MNNFICINGITEIFGNLAGCFLAILSIILLIKGKDKINNLLNLFNERHFSAVYGFYSNLYTYCEELFTTLKSNIEYWERSNNNQEEEPKGNTTYEELLKEKAKNIIDLFKSEKNQIPPEQDHEEWSNNIFELQKKLLKLDYIGELIYINNYQKFKKELIMNLEYFIGDKLNIGAIRTEINNIRGKVFPKK